LGLDRVGESAHGQPTNVSQLLHEEKAVTAEMAIRISSAVGGTPEGWLGMQQAVDLWDAGINLQSSAVLTRMQNHGGV